MGTPIYAQGFCDYGACLAVLQSHDHVGGSIWIIRQIVGGSITAAPYLGGLIWIVMCALAGCCWRECYCCRPQDVEALERIRARALAIDRDLEEKGTVELDTRLNVYLEMLFYYLDFLVMDLYGTIVYFL